MFYVSFVGNQDFKSKDALIPSTEDSNIAIESKSNAQVSNKSNTSTDSGKKDEEIKNIQYKTYADAVRTSVPRVRKIIKDDNGKKVSFDKSVNFSRNKRTSIDKNIISSSDERTSKRNLEKNARTKIPKSTARITIRKNRKHYD